MGRIRAVVVPVFLAHLVLSAVFLVAAESVTPQLFAQIEAAQAACAPLPHGPLRLVEYGGTIVAGRVAQAPTALLLLGPWPELMAPLIRPRCALPAPHPLALLPTRGGSYLLLILGVLVGTAFWSLASLAIIRLLGRLRRLPMVAPHKSGSQRWQVGQ